MDCRLIRKVKCDSSRKMTKITKMILSFTGKDIQEVEFIFDWFSVN